MPLYLPGYMCGNNLNRFVSDFQVADQRVIVFKPILLAEIGQVVVRCNANVYPRVLIPKINIVVEGF
jgi:hypothetical protein